MAYFPPHCNLFAVSIRAKSLIKRRFHIEPCQTLLRTSRFRPISELFHGVSRAKRFDGVSWNRVSEVPKMFTRRLWKSQEFFLWIAKRFRASEEFPEVVGGFRIASGDFGMREI